MYIIAGCNGAGKTTRQLQYSAGDTGLDNSGNTPNFVMQQVAGEPPVILDPDLYRQIKLAANE